ncbi:uncharacterized protein LOC110933875 [Helianthus annuus]|uniref:uncharacterized protein LOC110933875 n=1 Tax=Helianthus annuus TaxID=4232 RepID=UPI000B902701|nr:uncharacterized protein LOC110933875 [Helianthus annuus]
MPCFQSHRPTLVGLARRNIAIDSVARKLCDEGDENSGHLFSSCFIALSILEFISRWCGMPSVFAFSVKDVIMAHKNVYGDKKKNKAIQAIVFTAMWCLWKSRNELIFANKSVNVAKIKEDSKALGYLWIRNRSTYKTIMCKDWCCTLCFIGVFCIRVLYANGTSPTTTYSYVLHG